RLALIITDLMMPQMDGAELVAALRANAARDGKTTPPIILMTAASQRRAEAVGADVILRKPFDLDDLEALMRSLLVNASPTSVPASSPATSQVDGKDYASPIAATQPLTANNERNSDERNGDSAETPDTTHNSRQR
ncbi:MAG: response regulator, partial [Ktedonobacterales bacterium]